MIDTWQEVKLGDCAVLGRDVVSPDEMGETPYIGLEHIGENSLALLGHGMATDVTSAKMRFKKGDILFGKLRPYLRKIIQAPFDGICSTDIWVLRPTKSLDSDFLFHLVASKKVVDEATRSSEGTKMPRAKWGFLSQMRHVIPSFSEQRKIAEVLKTWDEEIEAIDALQVAWTSQKQGLMQALLTGKYRFVKFKDQSSWIKTCLGNLANISMGVSPKSESYNTENIGLPLIQGNADILNGFSMPRLHTSKSTKICQPGDILLSVRAPVGTVAISMHEACVGRGMAIIKAKSKVDQNWLRQLLVFNKTNWKRVAQGSTFSAINFSDIDKFNLVAPTFPEQLKISSCLQTWDEAIEKLHALRIAKINQKRGLMQKLLTGKIRVKR